MKNFKTIKQIVKELLTEDRTLADNDKKLCWEFWRKEIMENNVLYKQRDFTMDYGTYCLLTSESNITRSRRQIEQFHPELRGNTYNIRKNIKEPEAKEIINEEKWNEIGEINRYK